MRRSGRRIAGDQTMVLFSALSPIQPFAHTPCAIVLLPGPFRPNPCIELPDRTARRNSPFPYASIRRESSTLQPSYPTMRKRSPASPRDSTFVLCCQLPFEMLQSRLCTFLFVRKLLPHPNRLPGELIR